MAKKLRDIAGKGQFAGVHKSTVAPPDIDDKNLYNWDGAKDGVAFIKKHDTETHDYPYDAEAAFKGKKGGSKTTKYKFQKDDVYESSCNHTNEGVMCEVHGESACPSGSDQEPRYKGKKVLLDKKSVSEGRVEDVAHKKMTKALADIAKSSKVPVTKLKPGKKQYNELKSTGQMFGGARKFSAGLAKREIEGGEHGSSVGRAKVTGKKMAEEIETVNEVAPPNPKIEKWIKANKERFVKEYGKEKGTQVLYAKAWKMHGQSESGGATNTEYTGGTLGSTGRLDVGTL
jgi:hypothetical protein